jgi:hypothetical protein
VAYTPVAVWLCGDVGTSFLKVKGRHCCVPGLRAAVLQELEGRVRYVVF